MTISPTASAQARSTSVSSSAEEVAFEGFLENMVVPVRLMILLMVQKSCTSWYDSLSQYLQCFVKNAVRWCQLWAQLATCNNPLAGIYDQEFPNRLWAIASMLAAGKGWFRGTTFTWHPKPAGAMKKLGMRLFESQRVVAAHGRVYLSIQCDQYVYLCWQLDMGAFANLEVVLHNTCTTQTSNIDMDIQNLTVDTVQAGIKYTVLTLVIVYSKILW